MPIKGTKVTDNEKKKIIAFYQLGNSMGACSQKYGRSKGIVKRIIDEAKGGKFGDFVNEVEQINKAQSKEILSLLTEDNRTYQVMDKMLTLLNDIPTLKWLLMDKGMQQFTAFMGTHYDKILKHSQLQSQLATNDETSINILDILKDTLQKDKDV